MEKNEGKVKVILILIVAIGVIVISIVAMTYAFFTKSATIGNISVTSNNQFSGTIIYNSGTNITGSITPSVSKDANALSTSIMVTSSTSDITASLMAQVDLEGTTFLRSSGKAIMYEVYQKGSGSDDTTEAICTNNEYTCGENTCYCNAGSFVNHIDGYPFELISNYTLTQGNNYFDIYVWVDGNNSGDEVSGKTLRANFFFMSTSSSLSVTE